MKQILAKNEYTLWVAYHEAAHFVAYAYHCYTLGIKPEVLEVSIETPNSPLSHGGFEAKPFLQIEDIQEIGPFEHDPRYRKFDCILKQLLAGVVIDYCEEKHHSTHVDKWQFLRSKVNQADYGDDILQVLELLSILKRSQINQDYINELEKSKYLILALMDEAEMELSLLNESLDYVSEALVEQGTIRGNNLIPLMYISEYLTPLFRSI